MPCMRAAYAVVRFISVCSLPVRYFRVLSNHNHPFFFTSEEPRHSNFSAPNVMTVSLSRREPFNIFHTKPRRFHGIELYKT